MLFSDVQIVIFARSFFAWNNINIKSNLDICLHRQRFYAYHKGASKCISFCINAWNLFLTHNVEKLESARQKFEPYIISWEQFANCPKSTCRLGVQWNMPERAKKVTFHILYKFCEKLLFLCMDKFPFFPLLLRKITMVVHTQLISVFNLLFKLFKVRYLKHNNIYLFLYDNILVSLLSHKRFTYKTQKQMSKQIFQKKIFLTVLHYFEL